MTLGVVDHLCENRIVNVAENALDIPRPARLISKRTIGNMVISMKVRFFDGSTDWVPASWVIL